ncbi:MAG: histidine phosphatase family protein [Halomonas sp.]|uniref:histidine phosphatase family protein n=1 Tax=Halomonas sp. TaxID=1486246 RepID=UPI0017ACCAE5|nr:histidine phosphatase family protein [Halomonas sp.]NWN81564.1 histidine phosphatase family protein [Halomonas sp.]
MVAARRLELVVVRHGVTSWNLERRYQGQRDIPLLLPDAVPDMDRLHEHLAGAEFDAINCSDLARCRQTLAHVQPGRDASALFDPRLRELDFGDYEGRRWDELKDDPGYRAWIDSAGMQAPPGGESADMLWERLSAWLDDVLSQAEDRRHVLAVSHGGVIRELRRRLEAVDFWEGVVGQAQGRHFTFIHQGGAWRCSASSAVPVPGDAT